MSTQWCHVSSSSNNPKILSIHALGAAGWFALQSLPLIVTPSLVTTLLSREPHKLTDLESYLCRSLGLLSLTVALLQFLLTGLVPLSVGERLGMASDSSSPSSNTAKAPYQQASVTILTVYFALAGFYAYTQLTRGFVFAFAVGLIGAVALFSLGLWVLLFGNEKARISKSTGADKRTSAWPFANKESATEIKKRERETRSSSRRSNVKSR